MREDIEQIRKTIQKLRYLEGLEGLIFCDRWNTCPEEGFEYENQMGNFLSEIRNSLLLNEETVGLIKQFSEYGTEDYEDDIQRGQVRYLTAKYEEEVQIPPELRSRLNTACAEGQKIWEKSWRENDAKTFLPCLREQFELMKEIAYAIDPNQSPYQVLINRFDKDVKIEDLDRIFEKLKKEIMDILKASEKAWEPVDCSILSISPEKEISRHLASALQDLIGFDKKRGTMYEAHHPVCVLVGPRDSRPSTNYTTLFRALTGAAHESGHGMYSYNSPDTLVETGLWGGIEGTMQESQSKFYEHMIYYSEELWTAFLPTVHEYVPELRPYSARQVAYALQKPKREMIRLTADELTVSLHVIIRYELERDYYAGRLKIEDMEEAWSEKYHEYLGIRPKDSREGILQDVHWASGSIGYFQGYALGCMYSAQFRHKLLEDVPDAWESLAAGDIMPINQWMKDNIHRYGQIYTAEETLKKATGENLNPAYYIEYLREKYITKAPQLL